MSLWDSLGVHEFFLNVYEKSKKKIVRNCRVIFRAIRKKTGRRGRFHQPSSPQSLLGWGINKKIQYSFKIQPVIKIKTCSVCRLHL